MADDLEKFLNSLPDALADQLAGVIRAEAENLSAAQRSRLKELEQPPEDTGDLEASCTVVEGAHDLEVIVQAGGEATTRDDYDYAEAFEFGTSKQPARSFFYSTYREMKDDMQGNINEAVNEVLK
jgi:HK97 gp10 family phage protein